MCSARPICVLGANRSRPPKACLPNSLRKFRTFLPPGRFAPRCAGKQLSGSIAARPATCSPWIGRGRQQPIRPRWGGSSSDPTRLDRDSWTLASAARPEPGRLVTRPTSLGVFFLEMCFWFRGRNTHCLARSPLLKAQPTSGSRLMDQNQQQNDSGLHLVGMLALRRRTTSTEPLSAANPLSKPSRSCSRGGPGPAVMNLHSPD